MKNKELTLYSSKDKSKHFDEIWELLNSTYKNLGGMRGFSKENLINTPGVWKIARHDDKIIAGALYKDSHGKKLRMVFQDGTSYGKAKLKNILRDDFYRDKAWAEACGPIEKVLLSLGAEMISAEIAKTLFRMPIEIESDGYHYLREVQPGLIKRVVLLGRLQ